MPNTQHTSIIGSTVEEYEFQGQRIRIIKDAMGAIWYCAKDVATALGYKDTTNAVKRHCKAFAKGVAKRHPLKTAGGVQEYNFIGEGDVSRLIAHSQLPSAQRFEEWLFDEVVPTINHTGAYLTPATAERILTDPDFIISLAQRLKDAQQAQLEAELRAQTAEARAAELEPAAQIGIAFEGAPELMLVRNAAKYLTTAGVRIRERELFTWLVEHHWAYKVDGVYYPYAERMDADHLRLVPGKTIQLKDGREIVAAPTMKITRKGLCLLFRRLSEERGLQDMF